MKPVCPDQMRTRGHLITSRLRWVSMAYGRSLPQDLWLVVGVMLRMSAAVYPSRLTVITSPENSPMVP